MLLLVLPIFGAIGAAIWAVARLDHRRKLAIKTRLEDLDFRVALTPSTEQKEAFYAPLEHLTSWLNLRHGAASIDWLASSQEVGVFEHQYVTGSGRSTQEHLHTVAAFPIPVFVSKVTLAQRRQYWLSKLTRKREDLFQIGEEGFDGDWILMGEASTGAKVFNADVRALMQEAPKGESWLIGGNYVVLAFYGALTAPNLEAFLARGRRVWQEVARVNQAM